MESVGILEITDGNFDQEVLKSDQPVMIGCVETDAVRSTSRFGYAAARPRSVAIPPFNDEEESRQGLRALLSHQRISTKLAREGPCRAAGCAS